MEVRQNGIIVGLLGSSYVNSSSGYPISICQDVPFDLYWSQAGNLPQTIGIKIINPFGEVIYTKLPGEGTPLTVLYNSLGSCTPPTCPMPTNIEISNIAQNSVQLSWTESGTASQWEVFATKFGTSAPLNQTPLNSNNPLYHIANTNTNFLVPNLMSSTKYLFYVRALCSANDIGSWTLLNPPSCVTALANDNCADATLLPVNPGLGYIETVSGTTIGATASPEPTNCTGIEDDDVWFSFVATNPIHIINFLTSTGTNSVHYSVFTGDNCNALTQIYCSTTESYSNVFENLIVGNTYKIRVYTIGIGEYVSFEISINTALPPVNDNCDSAIEIPVQPYNGTFNTIQGTLLGATASTENFTCSGSADDDIWYKFTATTSKQQIKFTNNQGSYVTLSHAVYLGTNCSTASLVYCSTVSYGSTPSGLIPGQEYLIRVWSSSNVQQQGSFTISVMEIFPALTTSISQYTTQQLVTDVLVNNPCVSISNITTNQVSGGNNTGIGYFSNTSPFFPISSGIVLSTGRALSAGGPNTSVLSQDNQAIDLGSDTDLETIVYAATGESMISKNATKLEFDFTSQNEFMSFNFLFASEEYGTYQCQYADSFAFLLTDLLTGQTTNLAVVPGTAAPISVVTIRDNQYNMACTSENAPFFDTFFNDNLAYTAPTNFNGQTSVMSASSVIIPNNPYHIKLVIADRGDTAYDSAVFLQAGSFSSGPPECSDKVKLIAFIDANNNGIKEDTENSFTYGSFEYQLNDVGELNHISSPIGNYTLYDTNPLNSYDFSFAVHPEYAVYFSAGTTSHTNITIPVGSGTQTLYFPITQIQGYNDVTVSIIPMGLPVAGFSYYNKIVYTNLGTTPTSGTIDYAKDTNVSIVNTGNGISVTPTGFTYSFNNLAPFVTRSFLVKLNVPSIPTVNIGDVLLSNISISAPANDINLNNNAFNISQIVVASYDPNDKMEVHGGKLDIDTFSQTDYLFYTIRFQNTGTANAISIRVEDLLDSQLDEESLRMVSSSHNYVLERVGNHLIWKFDYIYLPSQLENEALSQGYVTFRIKVKPGFAVGDIIPNFAEIYFDTNPPIITNTFLSEFGVNLSAQTFTANTVILYPNPTHSILNVNLQGTSESIAKITIYDIIGKSIKTISGTNSQQMSINVSDLSTGVYMIEIITDTNMKQIRKFIVN
jgi:hypothetical protein